MKKAMNLVDDYINISPPVLSISKTILEEYRHKFNWVKDGVLIDLGCGPGNCTSEVIQPILPLDYKVVGCDISEEMIMFAQKVYGGPNIKFKLVDVSSRNMLEILEKNSFNQAVSFFCLHWVKDQRQLVQNIYNLLKPKGEAFLTILNKYALFSAYEQLAENSLWATYMKDKTKCISPYYNSRDPVAEFSSVLHTAPFKTVSVVQRKRQFIFPNLDDFKRLITSVNGYLVNVPEDLKSKYIDEELEMVLKEDTTTIDESGKVISEMELLECFVTK